MFRKRFKPAKCKTLVRLAISRIKLLRNKRDIQLKQMRRDLALLLQSGQDPSARIRVENVIREQNIMAAYDIIELFCELIVARLSIIESQSKCPADLREAISSLIFAAPRCADIPELLDIRDIFGVKYGKEFVAAAGELRPDCGVNRTIIEKLSVKTPSGEIKLKLMKEIAKEYDIDWDPTESETEFLKRPEDLLEGPNNFISASNMPEGSRKNQSRSVFGQKYESQSIDSHQSPSKVTYSSTHASLCQSPTGSSVTSDKSFSNQQSKNDSGSPLQSTSGRTNVHQDLAKHGTMHSALSSKRNSFGTENIDKTSEQCDSHYLGVTKGSMSGNSECNTYYKDTESAAKAAAESAEKAVAAARAAAELAKWSSLQNHHQQPIGSFYPSLSDGKKDDFCNSRTNRKSCLDHNQSFQGYDLQGRACGESHFSDKKSLFRSASGLPNRRNETYDSEDEFEDSGRQNASYPDENTAKYDDNSTPAMYYDNERSEKHFYSSCRDDPLRQDMDTSHTTSRPPRRIEMVYSDNLSSPVFDESDGTDSDTDEEIDRQYSISEMRNRPWSELKPANQPPTRPPPGSTSSSTLNNSQNTSSRRMNSKGSHVHPKLPDYDSLAARFESLRRQ